MVSTSRILHLCRKKLLIRISEIDLLLALIEATGKEFEEVACDEWTGGSIVEAIKSTKAIQNLPKIEEEIILRETVIPGNVIRGINEEQVKFKGEKWVVHKNDVDPFPSNPHAHNYEANLKLHLGNGELYCGTKLTGKIPSKKFKKFRELFKTIKMPPLSC